MEMKMSLMSHRKKEKRDTKSLRDIEEPFFPRFVLFLDCEPCQSRLNLQKLMGTCCYETVSVSRSETWSECMLHSLSLWIWQVAKNYYVFIFTRLTSYQMPSVSNRRHTNKRSYSKIVCVSKRDETNPNSNEGVNRTKLRKWHFLINTKQGMFEYTEDTFCVVVTVL